MDGKGFRRAGTEAAAAKRRVNNTEGITLDCKHTHNDTQTDKQCPTPAHPNRR